MSARYIKFAVTDGVGGFGSGRELYVFKKPGTVDYLPGDINNINVGTKELLNGNIDLFILKLKAKRKLTFGLKAIQGILIDRSLIA